MSRSLPRRQLSRPAFVLALSLCALFPYTAFGKGKVEETVPPDPVNTEWVFCITSFDVSALPPSRRILGEVLAAKIVDSLKSVDYRIRIFPEYTFYEGTAWSRARLEAGKKLAAKRGERDLLLYQGNAGWRYRRSLETVEKEIARLEEEYKRAEALVPEIGVKPVFKLTGENDQGAFPPAPESGAEKRFCVARKADAFLSGTVSEFHGRLYVVLRIYALYADSYIFEDSDIFSPEDLNIAAEQISGRLTAAISGTEPAYVQVAAAPENAMVLINNTYAGQGKTEILARSPGEAAVAVYAEDYTPQTFSLELMPGELAEISVNLTPLAMSVFNIDLPPGSAGSIYRGSLYIGSVPQTLDLAINRYEYLRVDTLDGKVSQAVVFGGVEPGMVNNLVMRPMVPKGKTDVDVSRRRYYGAYGRFWIALPIAYIIQGISTTVTNTYNSTANPELYDRAISLYWASGAAIIAAGGFFLESFIREIIYLVVSTRNEPKPVKTSGN
jgi:hypothetical protein